MLIRGDQFSVTCSEFFGCNNCCGAPAEKFGSIRSKLRCEFVESCHEIVVELDENFTSSHGHMVSPMVVSA
jgi:hypothetical protein